MTARMLLKSWAMPPASVPMASIFRACWSCSSSFRRDSSERRRSAISWLSDSFARVNSAVRSATRCSSWACASLQGGIAAGNLPRAVNADPGQPGHQPCQQQNDRREPDSLLKRHRQNGERQGRGIHAHVAVHVARPHLQPVAAGVQCPATAKFASAKAQSVTKGRRQRARNNGNWPGCFPSRNAASRGT